MTRQTELAWAAGFFDGEGSCVFNVHGRNRSGTTRMLVRLSVGQADLRPLRRFKRAVGVGNISKAGHTATGKPFWHWSTGGMIRVPTVVRLLHPYLSTPKREQIARVMKAWRLHKRRQ